MKKNRYNNIKIKKNGDYFTIPIADYLKHAVHFHELEWKLINRHVENGMVFLTPHESVRLTRKQLGNYIGTRIKSAQTPKSFQVFEEKVAKLVKGSGIVLSKEIDFLYKSSAFLL